MKIPETLEMCFKLTRNFLKFQESDEHYSYQLYVSASIVKLNLSLEGEPPNEVDREIYTAGYQTIPGRDRYHEYTANGITPLMAMQNLYKNFPNVRRS